MAKKNKNHYTLLFFLFLFFAEVSLANETIKFLSLKNSEVNVRMGPSKEYPIKFTYKKKYLPIQILDQFENWKKIKDFKNNTGWIHVSQLSKKRSAINTNNDSLLYKKPTIYSKPIAKLESGRLVLVKKCKVKWCKIKSGDYQGWVYIKNLWGRIK